MEQELPTIRITLITVVSFIFGVVSGTLTFWAYGENVAGAALAGLGTMAITFVTAYKLNN